MALLDFPLNPSSGDVYNAPNGVTYTFDTTVGPVGVWIGSATAPTPTLTITNPGTITGTAEVGATLTYTTGTATGGVGAISYTWQWFITPSTPIGPVGTQGSITVPAGALNKNIYVTLTATDSATPTANTATANTANFPSSGTIQPAGITNAAAPTTIPGTANFTWANGSQNLTASGCIEFSVNGGSSFTQASTAVGNGTNIITRWKNTAGTGTCGDAPQGTTITGTLTDGTRTSTFNFQINRVPAAFSMTPNVESTTPLTITTANPTFTLSGCNTAPLIWGTLTGGGSLPEFSIDGGTTWVTLPSAPTPGVYVPVGTPAKVRFKTSSGAGTETLDVYAGASTTASEYRSSLFTVTVATSPFPVFALTPAGAPNASPAATNFGSYQGLGSTNWDPANPSPTSLTSTGALRFQVNSTGGFGSGPTSISTGQLIEVIWDPTTIDATPDNTTLNATLTNGQYTESFSITVDKDPSLNIPADSNSLGGGATATIAQQTPGSFNAPVGLYYTTGTNTMTNVKVSINTALAVSVPTTAGTALVINPGDTLEFFGDIGTSVTTTYSITIHLGVFSGVWAETCAATPAIAQPTLVAPTGSPPLLLSPQYNTPAGIELITSAYSATGGAGAQTASVYEVYKDGYPLTSTNTISGVTQNAAPAWTQQTTSNLFSWQVIWDGTQYVCAGGDYGISSGSNLANIRTSPDGITWTTVGAVPPTGLNNAPWTIAYGNGVYVVGGYDQVGPSPGSVYRSTNLTSWSGVPALANSNPYYIFFANGLFIACTGNGVYTSPDGTTWNNRGVGGVVTGAYKSGLYLVAGPSGLISTSPDGTTWTTRTSGTTANLDGATYANGKFVVGAGSSVITSLDGITWSAAAPALTGGAIRSIYYGDGIFTAAGTGGKLATSPDGATWTQQTSGRTTEISDVFFRNGLWFTVGFATTAANGGIFTNTTPGGSTTLAIANCQTEGFLAGDTVISGSGAAAGPATILSLDNSQVTVTSSTGWVGNSTQTLKRDPASYSVVTGSPYSGTTPATPGTPSATVPMANLVVSSNYFWRAKYSTATPSALDSPWSVWNQFKTAASFAIAPGTPMGGGYFAGQIVGAGGTSGAGGLDNSGTIYNIIVAPVTGTGTQQGQYGGATPTGIAWRNSPGGDTNPNSQNANFGKLATEQFTGVLYPMFNWCVNGANGPRSSGGIGGFTDWYIPAKNELAILYFFLKPGTTANLTTDGSNPQSVSPYTPNTNYGPGFPNRTTADGTGGTANFRTGGAQAFDTSSYYWSSTEDSGNTALAWSQFFSDGSQNTFLPGKTTTYYARAIRRIAA